MTNPLIRLPVLAVLLAAPALAQDQLVVQATKKIDAVERALPGLAAGDVSGCNRLLADLKWASKRLKAAYKKDTSHWKAAAKRLEEADRAVRARAAAQPAGGGGGDAGKGSSGGAGSTGGKPAGSKNPAANNTGPVVGEQFAKLQQLDKEVRNGFHNLRILNKSFMGDAYRVGSIEKELRGLKARLAAFPAGDKNVVIVANNLEQFEGLFTKWRAEFAADQAASGDLSAKLDAITAKYASDQVPGPLHWPYERDKLTQWAGRTAALLEELPKDAAVVQGALGNSMLKRRAQSLHHRVASELPRRLGEQVAAVRYACDGAAKDALRQAERIGNVDPADRSAVANVVLMPGALERSLQFLDDGLRAVDLAATLDAALPPEQAVDRRAQRDRIEATITKVRALAKSSLADVRMPKPVDLPAERYAELEKIAATVLAKEKYGAHEIQKLVVTSKLQRKEKKEGTVSGTVTGARVTVYHYVWDEYRVVTAERVGDETWVFHNLIKYYHSSDTVTPQDVWILSRRFQGTQILAENVAK